MRDDRMDEASKLFWEFAHQCIAHPIMFLSVRSKWATRFHGFTADKAGFR